MVSAPDRNFLIPLLGCLTLSALIGCSSNGDSGSPPPGSDVHSDASLWIDEGELQATWEDGSLLVRGILNSRDPQPGSRRWTVELQDLEGNPLGQATGEVGLSEAANPFSLTLSGVPEIVSQSEAASYRIAYRLEDSSIRGYRSLYAAIAKASFDIIGPDLYHADAESFIRFIAEGPDGSVIEGAQVSADLILRNEDGEEERIALGEGQTDPFGDLALAIDVGDQRLGAAEIELIAAAPGALPIRKRQAVTIQRQQKILLTTDKPLYQPGQTIHIRALALRRPSLLPEAGREILFEVKDGKGNKVMKRPIATNEFGVAATDFALATLLNEGAYAISATMDDTVSEKTVTVEKYALPKFKVLPQTDRDYYFPGETVSGTVQADYFFGQPVSGGALRIVASKYDIELSPFHEILGTLNDEGTYAFSFELPDFFVGLPLEQGEAFVSLEFEVTDLTDHEQVATKTVPVVRDAVQVNLIPENERPIVGAPNRFFILTTDPLGAPLETANEIRSAGTTLSVETDASGFGEFELIPADGGIEIDVSSGDGAGRTAQREFSFQTAGATDSVLVRSDRAIYVEGDTAQIEILTTTGDDRVYLDAIRDNQTVLTSIVDIEDGAGSYALDLSGDLVGTLTLSTYLISTDGQIVRDAKVIQVNAANDLHIAVEADQEVYRPGDEATLSFKVTDSDNRPAVAALGINIVDEAVFYLQEFRPGLEKTFFGLEKDILQPRYEVHFLELEEIVGPYYVDEEEEISRQQRAEAFFALAGEGYGHGIHIDTAGEEPAEVAAAIRESFDALADEWIESIRMIADPYGVTLSGSQRLEYLGGWVEYFGADWFDPWGRAVIVEYNARNGSLALQSAGPDEALDTEDDLSAQRWVDPWGDDDDDMAANDDDDAPIDDGPWMGGGGCDVCGPDMDDEGNDGQGESPGGQDAPRLRSYFPETLYVNPSLITDANGEATLPLTMADSITTWRMSAMASSQDGRLGSKSEGILVFQDFFIDIDFPATLTQGDEIEIPVGIFNYLEVPQQVRLEAELAPWFTLVGDASQTVDMEAEQVGVAKFRVRVEKVGVHGFTVTAWGDVQSDAIRRTVEVLPDGEEIRNAESGRLSETIDRIVHIPAEAIEGASKLYVKIYPGIMSQAVEGLDSMFRMPSGCFEQTSSTTYPNVLVLDYLQNTGLITPEIELKAREYINLGYQRLLTFEIDSGGFEWFGNPPAHRILSAYGLLEFYDMAKVHEIDPDIIPRTQQFLVGLQNGDGSWDPDPNGYMDGAINNFTNSKLRNTAYIAWALLESGFQGADADRALAWILANRSDSADSYTDAIIANALAAGRPNAPETTQVLAELDAEKIVDADGTIHWGGNDPAGTESLYYSGGAGLTLETTALTAYAMMRAGAFTETAQGAIGYLIKSKDSFGNWGTTQGTVYALRALLYSLSNSVEEVEATVGIDHHNQRVETIEIDASNSELMRWIDLTDGLVVGDNAVSIVASESANLMYQIVAIHYLPRPDVPVIDPNGPLAIEVTYDKTKLETDETVTAQTVVSNLSPFDAKMIVVDLGIPPGFDPVKADLAQYVDSQVFQKVEYTNRQIIIYLYGIDAGGSLSFSFRMQARMPMRAQSGVSTVYAYYTPEDRAEAGSIEVEVE